MKRLKAALPRIDVANTEALGVHPDWVEAAGFAWLARETLAAHPGNLPSVTGAAKAAVLGAIYPA
jgi:anhydro-N-acetylmuramic acid kinase